MTPEQLKAYLEREMLKLLTQSGPIPYNAKGAEKIERCIFKAVGKLSRNIREGWYAGKFKRKHRRGKIYCLRDRQSGNYKTPRNGK